MQSHIQRCLCANYSVSEHGAETMAEWSHLMSGKVQTELELLHVYGAKTLSGLIWLH